MTDGKGQPDEEKIRTLGKKKLSYKYLDVLEVDTIKRLEMKEKIKSISGEPKKTT